MEFFLLELLKIQDISIDKDCIIQEKTLSNVNMVYMCNLDSGGVILVIAILPGLQLLRTEQQT